MNGLTGCLVMLSLMFVPGLSHTLAGTLFHNGLHNHFEHSAQLTHGLWQYFLSHFGHSHHHNDSPHHHTGNQHTQPEVVAPVAPSTPSSKPPLANETVKPVPGGSVGASINPLLSFNKWKNTWLLDHLSTCGAQTIEPLIQQDRIIGGTEAREGSWPWMVSFYSKTLRQPICAGSMISKDWIVSAAHCFVEFQLFYPSIPDIKDDLEVRVGLHNSTESTADKYMQTFQADRILIHPDFSLAPLDNDIALVRLSASIHYTDHALPLCLFGPEAQGGDMCVITGWGRQKPRASSSMFKLDPSAWPNVLKQAVVPVVGPLACGQLPGYIHKLTNHMICAGFLRGGVDTCSNDSGGPLLCRITADGRWALTGITSWGGANCAEANQPGVYTKVSGYYSWVLTTLYKYMV